MNDDHLVYCLRTGIPVFVLISCVCGIILVLGLVSGGMLGGVSIIIPVVILGTLAGIGILLGSACTSRCITFGSAEGSPANFGSRPSRGAIRRRMEVVGRLPHSERALLELPENERACSICLMEAPPERVILNCGHMFHETCVSQWMSRARFARCPLCRSGITPSPEQPNGDVTPVTNNDESSTNVLSPRNCTTTV
jgi:hypothetical protein